MTNSLTQRHSFVWRFPLDPATFLLIDEAAMLRDKEARTEEEENRLSALVAELPKARDLRITVRTPSTVDVARYRSLRRRGVRYVDAIVPAPDKGEDADQDDADEREELLRMIDAWSINMSVTESIEERAADLFDDESEWEETTLASEWKVPDNYFDQAPAGLHLAWNRQALDISPGVFGVDTTNFFRLMGARTSVAM